MQVNSCQFASVCYGDFFGHQCQTQVPGVPVTLGNQTLGLIRHLCIRVRTVASSCRCDHKLCTATITARRTKTTTTSRLSIPSLLPHVCLVMFQRMDASGQQRMAARDTRSSAMRRRERRLRAQWRHEQQTVAMALAGTTHHSAQRGEWRDLNEAPRGQRTASAEGHERRVEGESGRGCGVLRAV